MRAPSLSMASRASGYSLNGRDSGESPDLSKFSETPVNLAWLGGFSKHSNRLTSDSKYIHGVVGTPLGQRAICPSGSAEQWLD